MIGTQLAVTRLVKDHEYEFRIAAENKYGVGASLITDPVIAKNPFGKIYTGGWQLDCAGAISKLKAVNDIVDIGCQVDGLISFNEKSLSKSQTG